MIIQKPIYEKQTLFGKVYVAGDHIYFEEWTVELPAYDEADNFTIRAPWFVGGSGVQGSNPNTDTILITEKDVPIRVEMNGKDLISGIMDVPDWSFGMQGDSITITGRGMIGRMVDTNKVRNIKNRTASSVTRDIFASYGIKATIIETSRLIGSYSEESQSTNSEMNDWELLNWLAEWEGFVVRAREKEGFFGPADQLPTPKLEPLAFTYGSDCEIESLTRHQTGSREIIVEGRSYYNGRTIVEHYPRAPIVKKDEEWRFSDEDEGEEKRETAIIKRVALTGLSQDQLRQRVKSIYNEITKFDITGIIMVPKYVEVETDRRISLYGVGRGLSQDYYCTKVSYTENKEEILTRIHFSNKLKEVSGQ